MTPLEHDRFAEAASVQLTAICFAIGGLAELIMRIDPNLRGEVGVIAKELRREMEACLLILNDGRGVST